MRNIRPSTTRVLICAVLTLASSQVESAAAGQRSSGGKKGVAAGVPHARIALDLKMSDAQAVRAGFRLAVMRIREIPGCGALFAPLELEGEAALSMSSYARARPGKELALCERGALAVTRAGQAEIRLCSNFTRLSREGIAAFLIHEALHTAGLGEWPVDPEGPTSAGITRVVLHACSLGPRDRGAREPEIGAGQWARAVRRAGGDPMAP